jgi:3,4-dihydroxy-2-butanone 4-phosphate synthase
VPVDTTPKDTAVTPIVVPVDTSVAPVDTTADSTEISAGDSTTFVRPLPQRRPNMQQPGRLFYVNGRSVNARRAGGREASRIRTYSK